MALVGKGFFIWKIESCEGGDVNAIADQAQASHLTHVLVKIANGVASSNVDTVTGFDRVPGLVQALHLRGIQAWGWHYIYGANPLGEARKAIERIQQLGLDGYVADAEAEFKLPGKEAAARTFMAELRRVYPSLPIAFSSYRYPTYHPAVPYSAFLEKCDYAMPQVYWEQSHNPGVQLSRSVREYSAIYPYRPVIPTGPAYKTGGWCPTEADIKEFLDTTISLNLTSANFFNWDACRVYLASLWTKIGEYAWPGGTDLVDLPEQYVAALNSHNPGLVVGLYNSNAVHITGARTVQGSPALQTWFSQLLNQVLPNGTFTLTGKSASGSTRHFTWQANSSLGRVLNGSDTFGLSSNRISYHYTSFTISP